MKKLFMVAAAIIFTVSTNAQTDIASVKNNEANLKHRASIIKKEEKKDKKELKKLEGKEVSYQSKQAFYNDFGNTPATWIRTSNFDKAIFTKDGKKMTAYYDEDSKLVGTVSEKNIADLPGGAEKMINKKYAGYNQKAVFLFDDNELNDTDMLLYDQQFEDADNYFVELTKGVKKLVVKVNMEGQVAFFKDISK